jgi:hypothetical protein
MQLTLFAARARRGGSDGRRDEMSVELVNAVAVRYAIGEDGAEFDLVANIGAYDCV